jgi:site-specific DNA recombinase
MKRATIYARVSTDEQAEKGYSLSTQIEGCRRYAQDNGFSIVAELADDCSGAIPIVDRPQGRLIYELADKGAIDAVIIFTLDRTARDEKVIEYLLLKSDLYDRGVELHYSDTGIDHYTMEGNLVGYIKSYEAARERLKIIERTTRGKNAKAKEGKLVMNGHPPYGYRREGKGENAELHIYEPEAEVVRKMFEWYTTGNGNGGGPMSLRAIAFKLEERGEPTPNNRSNAAKYWIPATIRGILRNEIYAGRTYYGKTRIIKKKRVKQPREKWIAIDVPELSIIDRDTYQAAKRRAQRNKELAKRNRKHDYLLSGFFRCDACGGAMAGSYTKSNGGVYFYYRCGNHWHRPDQEPCPNEHKTISADIAENTVWDWLSGLLQDDDKLDRGLRRMGERSAAGVEPKRRRLETVTQLIEKADQKIKRLVSAFGEEEDETIAGAFQAEMQTLSKQKNNLLSERQSLELELTKLEITPDVERLIKERVYEIRKRLQDPTYEQIRALFDALGLKVRFRDDNTGRWLDVRCGLNPDDEWIGLHLSSAFSRPKRA